MKKRLFTLLVAGVMTISMTACGSSPAASGVASSGAQSSDQVNRDLSFAIVVKSMADQHWAVVKAGALQAAADFGVEVDVIGPNAESEVQQQIEMIENKIGEGVDGIAIAPSSPDTVLTVLKQADAAEIPVLAIDTDIPNYENKKSFIGTGNEKAGEMGGAYAAELVGEGGKAVILRGRLGDTTHDQREAGITAALEAGGVTVLEVRDCQAEAERAMNAMQDMLQRYDQIDVVVTTADLMAQGAQRAIESAGEDIPVVGFDGTIPVSELVAQGTVIKGTVAQSPFEMGYLAVENMIQLAEGKDIEERIDSGAKLITPETAQAYLDVQKAKIGA